MYSSWEECRAQVEGYSGAQYKAFSHKEAAEAFIHSSDVPPATSSKSLPSAERHTAIQHPVNVWVDGACIEQSNGTLLIGWAFLVQVNQEELHRDSGNDIPKEAYQHRNVAGEIMAVLKAISWCQSKHISDITIHHDYQGLASWVTGKWQAKTAFTQAYRDTVHQSGLTCYWVKVKAHSGEPGNEIVDKLAGEAALKPRQEVENGGM